ncbi:hypothetical protein QJQ45_000429 [Haematococcus lacustris]|nr:hypothetical protein QJQ45_000429 [Haematococcus lacustris]
MSEVSDCIAERWMDYRTAVLARDMPVTRHGPPQAPTSPTQQPGSHTGSSLRAWAQHSLPARRSKRTKAEPEAAEPTQPTKGKGKGKGKAAKAKPAPQPGRWLDRDCNAALNMQRIGESKWRPLELCYWPEQGKLPAKGKEYPGLGYKRLRDKPPKAQQQPAAAHLTQPAAASHLHTPCINSMLHAFSCMPAPKVAADLSLGAHQASCSARASPALNTALQLGTTDLRVTAAAASSSLPEQGVQLPQVRLATTSLCGWMLITLLIGYGGMHSLKVQTRRRDQATAKLRASKAS